MQQKRYNLFSERLKQLFGGRVHKISIDAGFGCPNRESGRSDGGCIFCEPGGSGSFGLERQLTVRQQVEAGKKVMARKYKAKRFMAYFQPFSNTFAPVERLRSLYDQALDVSDVVGLAVGTRPDCLADDVLDLLAEYQRRTCFWLEVGLQSSHDATLKTIGRGHDYACFLDALQRCRERGLMVCVHIILGLPGEGREQILETADEMARLKVDGIKLHLLHVLQGTVLGERYRAGEFSLLEKEEYVQLVCDVIERLHPETLIHRLTGDGPRDLLLAPLWSLKKWEVLNAIDAELARRDSRQGSNCRQRGLSA